MIKNLKLIRDDKLFERISDITTELSIVRDEYEKMSNRIMQLHDTEKQLRTEQIRRIVENNTASNKVDWAVLLEYQHCEANYKFLQKAMTQLSPQGWVCNNGYNPKIAQYIVQLRLNEDSNDHLKTVESQLLEVIPFIIPFPDIGEKCISLLEPSLSANGSYSLREKDNNWSLNHTRWSNPSIVAKKDSLFEMLQYLQDNFSFHSND